VANHKSALKRARQNEKRRIRNRAARSGLRTEVKRFISSVEAGSANTTELSGLMSQVAALGTKGVIPKKRAARQVSRMAKLLHKSATKA
jgi:small subunit ribosomal protein S20